MPYIDNSKRELVDTYLDDLLIFMSKNDLVAGDLNYIFTKISHQYIIKEGKNYQNMNNVVGALFGALTEFQRIVVNPYEDQKISLNGKVSEL